MGTGGAKNGIQSVACLIEHFEAGLAALDGEIGQPGSKPEKFRNTQTSGVYLFNYLNTEFEVVIRIRKKEKK